jgi:hypothetical protein
MGMNSFGVTRERRQDIDTLTDRSLSGIAQMVFLLGTKNFQKD